MDLVIDDFIDVINILQQRENCKVNCRSDKGKIIFSSDDNSELDLCIARIKNKLVIRRVAFKNKRTGTFKMLFKWFSDYCLKKGMRYIILETIVSHEMLAFAVNNNFKPVPGKIIKDGQALWGDYEYRINKDQ